MQKLIDFTKRHWRKLLSVVIILTALGIYFWPRDHTDAPQQVGLSVIERAILNKEVQSATIILEQGVIRVQIRNGPYLEALYATESADELQERLRVSGADYEVDKDERSGFSQFAGTWAWILIFPIVFIGLPLLAMFIIERIRKAKLDPVTKPKERPVERFSDVKGADEVIAELRLVVDSLSHPDKYDGLRFERGIILHGPPGTGKTLLAKAVAGEADVPFYRMGGAELVGMYAGQTTENVGSVFKRIRKDMKDDNKAPFVLFIDEVDSIASKRTGGPSADRDRDTTVTQLLDQISRAFETYASAVIIAASNHLEVLDEAIKRPGRLGKHIAMPNPDLEARRQILALNSKGLDIDADDLDGTARLTASLSGAAVSRVPQEAALIAYMNDGDGAKVTREHIELATMQIVMGTLRTSAVISDEEKRITAIHESGHSTVAAASPFHRLLISTVIPINESGGSTWTPPDEDSGLRDAEFVDWQLAVTMGGRQAELLENKRVSTGPAHDLESATNLALHAVCSWGLYEDRLTVVNPKRWQEHPDCDEINRIVQDTLERARQKATELLEEHSALREAIRDGLIERRILHSDELAELTSLHLWPDPE